jgi:hypothetical protein
MIYDKVWYDIWYDTIYDIYLTAIELTHLDTNSTQNTENGTYITIKRLNTHNRIFTNLVSAVNNLIH